MEKGHSEEGPCNAGAVSSYAYKKVKRSNKQKHILNNYIYWVDGVSTLGKTKQGCIRIQHELRHNVPKDCHVPVTDTEIETTAHCNVVSGETLFVPELLGYPLEEEVKSACSLVLPWKTALKNPSVLKGTTVSKCS